MKRNGFMFADALIGIFILAAAAALLAGAMGMSMKATRTVAEHRAALATANAAMLSLQTGAAVQADSVTVVEMDTPAPAGWRWVRVVADHRKGHAEIIGLVRRSGS